MVHELVDLHYFRLIKKHLHEFIYRIKTNFFNHLYSSIWSQNSRNIYQKNTNSYFLSNFFNLYIKIKNYLSYSFTK